MIRRRQHSPNAGPARRRAGRGLAAVTLVAGLVLSGCVAQADLGSEDAAAFRERVAAVGERSLAGDYAGATAELALLETAVAEASDAGTLGDAREARITDAIAVVRADLDAQIQAQQAAEQAAREAAEAAEQAAAAETARVAAEQAAAEEAARRADERGKDKDKDNRGPGKNNGNGNNGNGNGNRGGGSDEDDE
ncbi:hypothetical protein [Agromyces silvae]|uniref:hypothetical protein n=1 Tax=Agromyces silvae TaxID=3388266 RepID=UPI00280AB9CE|nr:hypothetical protein [Agromyces protaetiae]